MSWDGVPVTGMNDLYDRITYSAPGKSVALEVIRGGKRLPPIQATLGTVPLEQKAKESKADLNQ